METLEVDIAIAGGGACGIMAALRAGQDPQVTIAVFEKSTRGGCNAEISSGSLAAAGTRFQRDVGIDDTPEQHAREILAASDDEQNANVVHAVCAAAPRYVEWLHDDLGFPLEVGIDMPRAGMSVPRLHADPGRRGGRYLMTHLRRSLERLPNVAFVDEAPCTGLLTDDHRVVGIEVEQNGQRLHVRAPDVVLAVDGFAANAELVRRHGAALGEPMYGGVETSTGDAIPWLEKLDVELRHLGSFLRHGLTVLGHGTRVSPALPFAGAVLIDRAGERFVEETSVGYSGLAEVMQKRADGRATLIWDEEAMQATRHSELMRESLDAGAISTAPDLASLARTLGLATPTLERALRPRPGRRQLRAPYYLAAVTHGVLASQGGAVVDAEGRVLRRDGSIVEGLRAGGGTAVGFAGARSGGYSSGNGLLTAFGMGWIIGERLHATATTGGR